VPGVPAKRRCQKPSLNTTTGAAPTLIVATLKITPQCDSYAERGEELG
jgi:hypothetical protein